MTQAERDRAEQERRRCPKCRVITVSGQHAQVLVDGQKRDCPYVGYQVLDGLPQGYFERKLGEYNAVVANWGTLTLEQKRDALLKLGVRLPPSLR